MIVYHSLRDAVKYAMRFARQIDQDFIVVRSHATNRYGWYGAAGIVNLTGCDLICRVTANSEYFTTL